MLKILLIFSTICVVVLIGYTWLESATRNSIHAHEKSHVIENTLLERGQDLLAVIPYNASQPRTVKFFVLQDYGRERGIFNATRGLYGNFSDGLFNLGEFALKRPEVFTSDFLDPVHFHIDDGKVLDGADLLAVAGPFLTSVIPLDSISKRKEKFQRVLILGSGIGTVSRFYQTRVNGGSILVDAVEEVDALYTAGKKFFGIDNTSRVTYFKEGLMGRVDHTYKMGIKYDSIHVGPCRVQNCPTKRPDKLAMILSANGTISFGFHVEEVQDVMKKLSGTFGKSCFQVGVTTPVAIIFCSPKDNALELAQGVRAKAMDFDSVTKLNVTSLISHWL